MSFTLFVVLLTCFLTGCLSKNDDSLAVRQVHIALAGVAKDGDGHSNSMSVSWNTQEKSACSSVKYGLSSGEYIYESTGEQSSYWESWNHHVKLGELKPNTKYYYVAGCGNMWSDEKSFTSAPETADLASKPWDFIAFGDLGVVNGEPTADYLNDYLHSADSNVKLVWHAGDIGYADDSFLHFPCYTHFCYERRYDEYMDRIQDKWASNLPYMTMPGNHEADCHSPACMVSKEKREKLSNFTAFSHRFNMPSEESNGTMNQWYSFNYGNVHFVSIFF